MRCAANEVPYRRMTDDEIKDAIIAQGMLSPVIDGFAPFIEETHAGWFDFTTRINDFASPKWVDHSLDGKGESIGTAINIAIPLMARCLDAFAASVILAKRGMTIEAGTMARSIYEAGFWIGYLHKDAIRAGQDFWTDELKGAKGREEQLVKVYADEPERASMHRKESDKIKAALVGRDKPSIETVAIRAGYSMHFAFYKSLCGIAAHPTVTSIQHYLTEAAPGVFVPQIGVDEKNVGKMLGYASHGFLMALHAFLQITEDPDPKYDPLLIELNRRMGDEATREIELNLSASHSPG